MKYWKRFAASALALGLSLSLAAPALADDNTLIPEIVTYHGEFTDVKNTWAEAAIKTCYETGILIGFTPTQFAPHVELSHAQLAVLSARFHAAYEGNEMPTTDGAVWYQNSVDYLRSHGLLSGWSSRQANTPCTYQYFLEKFNQVLDACGIILPVLTENDDIIANEMKKKEMDQLFVNFYRTGVLDAQFVSTMKPGDILTRDVAAAMLARMINAAGHA